MWLHVQYQKVHFVYVHKQQGKTFFELKQLWYPVLNEKKKLKLGIFWQGKEGGKLNIVVRGIWGI